MKEKRKIYSIQSVPLRLVWWERERPSRELVALLETIFSADDGGMRIGRRRNGTETVQMKGNTLMGQCACAAVGGTVVV